MAFRHFQQTLRGEALLGKFPNLSGEPENSFHFCPESGELEIFRFLGILRSNSPLEIDIKKFYIKMLFLKKKILNLEVIFGQFFGILRSNSPLEIHIKKLPKKLPKKYFKI